MRKSDSWLTVSTSGELFMMVLTRAMGSETSFLGAPAEEGLPPEVGEVALIPDYGCSKGGKDRKFGQR